MLLKMTVARVSFYCLEGVGLQIRFLVWGFALWVPWADYQKSTCEASTDFC